MNSIVSKHEERGEKESRTHWYQCKEKWERKRKKKGNLPDWIYVQQNCTFAKALH